MVALERAELIVRETLRARQKAERRRLDEHAPVARLPANRAVAFTGTGREIDLRFEFDIAAMATAFVGLQHRLLLCFIRRKSLLQPSCHRIVRSGFKKRSGSDKRSPAGQSHL